MKSVLGFVIDDGSSTPASVIDLRAYAAGAAPTAIGLPADRRRVRREAHAYLRSRPWAKVGRCVAGGRIVILLSGTVTVDSATARLSSRPGGARCCPPDELQLACRIGNDRNSRHVPGGDRRRRRRRSYRRDRVAAGVEPAAADLLVGRRHRAATIPTIVRWTGRPPAAHAIRHPITGGRWCIDTSSSCTCSRAASPSKIAAGSVRVGKGDIFLATRGAQCAWISKVHVKKVYAIHRPA